MKEYTIVLLRPSITNNIDPYIAFVTATSIDESIEVAKQEVFDADTRDLPKGEHPESPNDYRFVSAFYGHPTLLAFA